MEDEEKITKKERKQAPNRDIKAFSERKNKQLVEDFMNRIWNCACSKTHERKISMDVPAEIGHSEELQKAIISRAKECNFDSITFKHITGRQQEEGYMVYLEW